VTSIEPQFQARKESRGNIPVLHLSGVINERTELNGLFDGIEGDTLIINLKGVTRINSCGVRDWVNAAKPLAAKFTVTYEECSRAIVEQLNMIVNFLNSGKIVSFFAPYYCDSCDEEHEMLVVISEHFEDEDDLEEPEAPDFDCPKCGKTMEFNEDEDKYMSFLIE